MSRTPKARPAQWFACFLVCITVAAGMVSTPLGLFVLGMDFLMLAFGSWVASKAQPIIEEIVGELKAESEHRLTKYAHDLGSSIVGLSKADAEEYAGPAPTVRTEIIPWYRKAMEMRAADKAEAMADAAAWSKR